MIIVQLIGGLGNQLFQYAQARRIAHVNNVQLKLDILGFEDYKLRTYNLTPFNIIEEFASRKEISRIKSQGTKSILSRLAVRLRPDNKCVIVREKYFHFDPDMLNIGGNVYLEGYWQSEKYFKEIEEIIRREFTIKHKPDAINEQKAQHIMSVNAVSLHIRRADYVANPQTNQTHGTCSLEYYSKAVITIAEKINKPFFFVFSDDPVWARNNLKIDYPMIFVDHNNADKNYEDLRLISLCKHHIIANSSFSWWGAWLCNNKDKIVIAPEKWFNKKEINTTDLIPESWIRI